MELEVLGIAILAILVFLTMSKFWQFLILSGLLGYFLVKERKPKKTPLRSLPFGKPKSGETVPRRNYKHQELVREVEGCQTLPDLVIKAIGKFKSKQFLGSRRLVKIHKEEKEVEERGEKKKKVWETKELTDYKWMSFERVGDLIEDFSVGILQTGIKPRRYLSIFAETRAEWMITATACLSQNIAIVTVYASLGEEALAHGFGETEVSHVITEANLVKKIVSVSKKCPKLKTVIYFDELPQKELDSYKDSGLQFFSYDQVLDFGSKHKTKPKTQKDEEQPDNRPSPEDLAIIMYTSGSTGTPKGVMVTHQNFISVVAGVGKIIDDIPNLGKTEEGETYLAYLPLAHILELACEVYCMSKGFRVGYGTPQTLKDAKPVGDILALSPTMMAGVPAIWERLRTGILANIKKKGPIFHYLFKVAYHLKKQEWIRGRKSPWWDKVFFSKVQEQFGGKLKLCVSGGAPLSASTHEFIGLVLGVSVLQGYGLTETCAGGTLTEWDDREFGRVGAPVPCVEIKLVDVPDMNYTSRDFDENGESRPRGEICIRGGCVTKGYFNLKDKTDEVFKYDDDDKESKELGPWFYTGDIGRWNTDGTLEIIDRKKDLVKLRHGEYIALGQLESKYRMSPYVENIVVHASGDADAPVALVVPNEAHLHELAKSKGVESKDLETICKNDAVKKAVLSSLLEQADKAGLKKVERVTSVHITAHPWTKEEGLLTEALKIKRNPIYDHHKKDLEAMYKQLNKE